MVHQISGVIIIIPPEACGLKAQSARSLGQPYGLKAQQAPSPGQRPGYSEPVPLRPERAKALFTLLSRALGVAPGRCPELRAFALSGRRITYASETQGVALG